MTPEDEAELGRAEHAHRHAVVGDPHGVTRPQFEVRPLGVSLTNQRAALETTPEQTLYVPCILCTCTCAYVHQNVSQSFGISSYILV